MWQADPRSKALPDLDGTEVELQNEREAKGPHHQQEKSAVQETA